MTWLIFCFMLLLNSCFKAGVKEENCINDISPKDLKGEWKLKDFSSTYTYLSFWDDMILYVEHETFRRPYFYFIDSNQQYITVRDKSKILHTNNIVCLTDSLLHISSLIELKENRIYEKVKDADVGKRNYSRIY